MKTKILRVLEDSRGGFVSGESLADTFGVTRAAVWKAIESLRRDGHKIKAFPNKGYSLLNISDILTGKGITAHLREGSKVCRVICLSETDSTNNYAKKLAMSGAAHGTLVAANHQTAGRGRYGHSFESPPGTGLYMTLMLRPNIETAKFQMITIASAVAVSMAIEELCEGMSVGIKWVNDIYLRDRKIAGILTEAISSIESGEIECVIVGIGINVSTKNFPHELAGTAGSIFPDGNILFGRDELCAHIADNIMNFAEDLNAPDIIAAYRERSILTARDITYIQDGTEHKGHVEGIDDSGGLVVVNEAGETETLRAGEVFMVRRYAE